MILAHRPRIEAFARGRRAAERSVLAWDDASDKVVQEGLDGQAGVLAMVP